MWYPDTDTLADADMQSMCIHVIVSVDVKEDMLRVRQCVGRQGGFGFGAEFGNWYEETRVFKVGGICVQYVGVVLCVAPRGFWYSNNNNRNKLITIIHKINKTIDLGGSLLIRGGDYFARRLAAVLIVSRIPIIPILLIIIIIIIIMIIIIININIIYIYVCSS